jgi:hypothetical protein
MDRKMTPKQIEYETRRAKAANLTLEQWLRKKSAAEAKTMEAPKPKKPSLLGRLIDRAHKPLKPTLKPGKKT